MGGYTERQLKDDVAYNPSIQSMEAQLYRYILKILGEKAEQRKTDRQILEMLSNNPNAMPLFTVRNEELKQQDNFNHNFIGWNFLYYKMQESEQILFNMIDSIRNGTSSDIPLYFQAIIETAKEIIRNNLLTMRIEPKQIDYYKLVDSSKKYREFKGISGKTIQTHSKMVLVIAELLNGKKIRNLLKKDIKELECKLLLLPQNYAKKYSNKSAQEIIEEIKEQKMERLSAPTVRNYIMTFSNFVNFLVDEDIVDVNPFSNYHFKFAVAKKESYLPFTDSDLKKIFAPQTYPLREAPNNNGEDIANFWVPLLKLFLGSRINELCQLDVDDIQLIQGIYCIIITPDDRETAKNTTERKQTKTKESRINLYLKKL